MTLNKFCFLSSFDVSKFFSGTPDTTTKNKKNKKTKKLTVSLTWHA